MSDLQPLSIADLQRQLTTRRFGRRLHYRAELDSTNTTARELAESGAEEGTVVIAESQRRGRGRLGRTWVSPPNRNCYLSLVLRPLLAPSDAPLLTLVAGLAAVEAAREWHDRVAIKWPNDLVADGRKLGGILTEMSTDNETIRFVVAGIGVNLNSQPEDFPPEVRAIATSLCRLTGAPVDRAGFAARLLYHLEQRYDQFQHDGFAPLATVWEQYSCLTNRDIVVQSQAEHLAGVVLGLASDGTLRVRDAQGNERRVVAGDVTVVGGYDRGAAHESR